MTCSWQITWSQGGDGAKFWWEALLVDDVIQQRHVDSLLRSAVFLRGFSIRSAKQSCHWSNSVLIQKQQFRLSWSDAWVTIYLIVAKFNAKSSDLLVYCICIYEKREIILLYIYYIYQLYVFSIELRERVVKYPWLRRIEIEIRSIHVSW